MRRRCGVDPEAWKYAETGVDGVVLRDRPKHLSICWHIALRECGHDAPGRRCYDKHPNPADRQFPSDPLVLDEAVTVCLDHDIWTESLSVELTLGSESAEATGCTRRDEV